MILNRKFVDFDGNVLDETDWRVTPLHKCFYCNTPLIQVGQFSCPIGFLGKHDFVTLCQRD